MTLSSFTPIPGGVYRAIEVDLLAESATPHLVQRLTAGLARYIPERHIDGVERPAAGVVKTSTITATLLSEPYQVEVDARRIGTATTVVLKPSIFMY